MIRTPIIAAVVGLIGLALLAATAFTGNGYMLIAGIALVAGFIAWGFVTLVLEWRA